MIYEFGRSDRFSFPLFTEISIFVFASVEGGKKSVKGTISHGKQYFFFCIKINFYD